MKTFTASLSQPYCGVNSGFEAVAVAGRSVARDVGGADSAAPWQHRFAAFGMLVLGSPDATRYTADMGTEFLVRIGEMASAAIARLLPVADGGPAGPASTGDPHIDATWSTWGSNGVYRPAHWTSISGNCAA